MCLLNFVLFFQINYKCGYGDSIYVVGNIRSLGNWNFQKALKLTWSEGHNWSGMLKIIHDNREPIQYKYIIAPTEGGVSTDQVQWERGSNRFIDLYSASKLLLKLDDEWEQLKVRIAVPCDALKKYWNSSQEVICYTNLTNKKSHAKMKIKKYIIQGNSKEESFWTASFYVPYNINSFNYKLRVANCNTNETHNDLIFRRFDLKKFPYHSSPHELYKIQQSTHTKFDFRFLTAFNFDPVTEEIVLGSFPKTSKDIEELVSNGVKAVINLQTASDMRKFSINWDSLQQQYQKVGIVAENFPIQDMDNKDLSLKIRDAANLIDKMLRENGKVYVHCTAGKYRSPHAIIYYLWSFKQIELDTAINLIKNKRRKIKINIFEEVFKQNTEGVSW